MTLRSSFSPPSRIKYVGSFDELAFTRFSDGVNALCWRRDLGRGFDEVVRLLGTGEGIVPLDEEQLNNLPVSATSRAAIEAMLKDLHSLRELGLDPELNCIHHYPRDEQDGPVATDVFSFHADSATAETDTWLCTYHGASSEGLVNEQAVRRVDVPATRGELLRLFGGGEGETFREFLAGHCYDLHYAPLPGAQPYSFGIGNLWRIATEWPESPVPPCIHRAPETRPEDPPRLLLIS